jgi:hypothetical protein
MKLVPYERIGEPEDIGNAAVFLASDMTDYITGTTLFVERGFSYNGITAFESRQDLKNFIECYQNRTKRIIRQLSKWLSP